MSQRILVTGARGLIGTAVCCELERRGAESRVFDIADLGEGYGDVRSRDALAVAMQDCDGVIHLAAVSRVIWGERDPDTCWQTNVEGTRNLVESAMSQDTPPWVILASSREVYGQRSSFPVREGDGMHPMNNYAQSKVAAENAVSQATAQGLRSSILRFSTVYGSVHDHPDRVIPAFCLAALADKPLFVEGNKNFLDITHVEDVARCVCDVAADLEHGIAYQPMHLTSGHRTSLLELAGMITSLSNSKSKVTLRPSRAFDVTSFVGDPALAREQVNWNDGTPLEIGLAFLLTRFRREQSVRSL